MPESKFSQMIGPGDIVLVCGPARVGVLASSYALTCASREFASLIRGHEAARRPCRAGVPDMVEIRLEDDDPTAMAMLCRTLNWGYNWAIDPAPRPRKVVKMARLAVKYGCTGQSPVQYYVAHWFDGALKDANLRLPPSEMSFLLLASYLLDMGSHFEKVARHLLMQTKGRVIPRPGPEALPPPLEATYDALETQLQTRRAKILDLLEHRLDLELGAPGTGWQGCAVSSTCSYEAGRFYSLALAYKAARIWPPATVESQSLQHVLSSMRAFELSWADATPCSIRCPHFRMPPRPALAAIPPALHPAPRDARITQAAADRDARDIADDIRSLATDMGTDLPAFCLPCIQRQIWFHRPDAAHCVHALLSLPS